MRKTSCGKDSCIQASKGITSKPQIIKNLIILSSGFLLLFTGSDGLSVLQSTINREHGIGVASQATIYVSFCISALLFPKYVIQKIGCKNTIVLSMLTYLPYISSNFYPHWILMIPSSILSGLGASLLWGAQCTYLNEIAKLYFQASSKKCISNSAKEDEYKIVTEEKNLIRKYSLSSSRSDSDKGLKTHATTSLPNIFKTQELKFSHPEIKQYKMPNNILHKEEINLPVNIQDSSNFAELNAVKGNTDNQDNVLKDGSITEISVLNLKPLSSVSVLPVKATDTDSGISDLQCNASSKIQSCHEDVFSHAKEKFLNYPQDATQLPNKSDYNYPQDATQLPNKSDPTKIHNKHLVFPISTALVKDGPRISNSLDSTTARFFGFHGLAYFSTHIWSNLMSYYVLQTGDISQNVSSNFSCVCGASFCNIESKCFEHNLAEPSLPLRYTLTGICSSFAVCAVLLIALFLDKLKIDKKEVKFSLDLLMATLRLAKEKEQILLIPLSFYVGMVQGFYSGDFTKSYIACAWGTYHIGLVTVCYGSTCALSSTASGWLIRRLGRLSVFLTAALISGASTIILLIWVPDPRQPFMFFLVAGLWGLFIGTFWSQLRAFYGVLFKGDEEAAFGSFYLWYSLGFALSFAYSNYFCTSLKIYILLAFSIAGILGYIYVEISCFKNKTKL